jgi:hypothetical protein
MAEPPLDLMTTATCWGFGAFRRADTGLAAPTISLKTIGGEATRSFLGSSATPRLRRLAAPFELAPSLALFG